MLARHLYVHVPFCARRCAYCDFSIAFRREVPVAAYLDALRSELALHREPSDSWTLDTLYFGGGTPSLLGGEGIATAIAAVRDVATLAADAEITLEANPDDVRAPAAEHWRAAGVTRVSLGVQSFDDAVLQWMHRSHNAEQARAAVATLRAAGIANISLDLIFALPAALERDWAADLRRALELQPSHISLYGLTVEPGTPLARWRARGRLMEAPEESYESDFSLAHDALTPAAFEHYEVSSYALPGHRSRHNSAYWSGAAYLGVGPSAHSFGRGERSWNVPGYTDWERRLRAGFPVEGGRELLTTANESAEQVYLSLRTSAGLRLRDGEQNLIQPWLDAGWAELRDGVITLTTSGWLRLDSLAAFLTAARSDS